MTKHPGDGADAQNQSAAGRSVCARCAATFECGAKAGAARCWCFDLPAVTPSGADAQCLCPACLTVQIAV